MVDCHAGVLGSNPGGPIIFSSWNYFRPKIRPKNGFFCYVPFLGLIFWVTFCSNSNTLTFDSKVSIWNKSLVKNLL